MLIKDYLKGSSIIFVGLVFGKSLSLLNNILLGRFLGAHDFGVFLLGLSVVQISTVIPNLGIPSILPKCVSESLQFNDIRRVEEFIALSLGLLFLIGTASGAVVYLSTHRIANTVFHSTDLVGVLKLLSFAVPVVLINGAILAVYRGYQRTIEKVLLQDILPALLKVSIFLILYCYFGLTIYAACYAYLVSVIAILLLALIVLNNSIGIKVRICFYNQKITAQLLKLSWPLAVQSVVWIIYSQIDRICLGIFLPPADVGIYGAAFSVANILYFIPKCFSYLALPRFSSLYASNSLNNFKATYLGISKIMFGLSVPLLCYLLFFSKSLLRVLYGATYTIGSTALFLISLGILSASLSGPAADSLVAAGKTKDPLIAILVGCVCNITLNIFLIPLYGINGAAAATCISLFIANCILNSFNYYRLKIFQVDGSYLLWILVCMCLMPLLVILRKTVVSNTLCKLILSGLIYFPVSYLCLYIFLVLKSSKGLS